MNVNSCLRFLMLCAGSFDRWRQMKEDIPLKLKHRANEWRKLQGDTVVTDLGLGWLELCGLYCTIQYCFRIPNVTLSFNLIQNWIIWKRIDRLRCQSQTLSEVDSLRWNLNMVLSFVSELQAACGITEVYTKFNDKPKWTWKLLNEDMERWQTANKINHQPWVNSGI